MTKEQLEKDYYADRPPEPYCDDVSSSDCANLAHYAEENLEKTFERIEELEKENAELRNNYEDYKVMAEGRIDELEQKYSKQADDFENMKAGLESEITELKEENKQLRNNYDDYKAVAEDEIMKLKELLIELYDCIPSSMADSCRETLQKVALVFKED